MTSDPITVSIPIKPKDTLYDAHVKNFLQDMALRKSFSLKIFILVCVFLGLVILILIGCATNSCPLHLSDNVLIALLGSTTINVLGFFTIVANYVFPKKS